MVSNNYVRVGRLVRILRGPRQDKVGVIADIVDGNRVVVENPSDSKMWRHVQNLRNVEPLKFSVAISRNADKKAIAAALATGKALEKYGKSRKATAIAASQALANSTDFERYQLRVAKRSRAFWTRKSFDENDKKKPVSHRAIVVKKLEKSAKKFDAKHAARIKKAVAKKAAKKAAKKK
jgi:large subunit ribosomal protein L14e